MRSVQGILERVDEARVAWNFKSDPGAGVHDFGEFTLLVNSNEVGDRYVVIDDDGKTVTMSYGWESISQHLTTNREWSLGSVEEEENDMAKSAMHDEVRKEKTRLKCKNDWDLELTDDQVKMCIIEEEETGLSIWHNQLWPNKRNYKQKIEHDNGRFEWVKKTRITWDKTIDGYRAVAAATGLFAGVDAPVFSYEGDDNDMVARVTVYRLDKNGGRQPFIGEARFSEFVQLIDEWKDKKKTGRKIPNHIWAESPKNQISVAAERQALRKAFQSCVDNQPLAVPIQERSEEVDEPVSEPSRGSDRMESPPEAKHPAKSKPKAEKKPEPKPESKPEPKKEEKPEGKYVGIPKGGFKVFQKYNKDERIVLFAKNKDSSKFILGLDSGQRVAVNGEGFEIERKDRTDKQKGGREWKVGDTYYDGSKVLKMADAKKDPSIQRLLLDSNFEVRLDRWGKEIKRKAREQKKGADNAPKNAGSNDGPPPGPPHPDIDESSAPQESAGPPSPAPQPSEALAAGKPENMSIEDAKDTAMARKLCTPLLKSYCKNVLKKRISFKAAYEHLTGVILQKGNEMQLHDYKALYECLEEAIHESKVA